MNGFATPYLSDIVVSKQWRRLGVASKLLSYCENEICRKEWGESCVHLWVETWNSPAVSLYRKLLYVPIFGETGPLDESAPVHRFQIKPDDVDCQDYTSLYDRILMRKTL